MKVSLIDVDSKIPNLALMKTSSWHKKHGDEVKLGYEPLFDNPDVCCVSKIFNFTKEPEYIPKCHIIKGGTGYDPKARLPFDDYDKIYPDYSIYDTDIAIGRFTRGCPNNCPWCIVPKMDGNDVHKVADLKDFASDKHRVVRLLDDNIMADKDIFDDACNQLHNENKKAIWDALDIRFVDKDTAYSLSKVKLFKTAHFAWDGKHQEEYIERGLRILNDAGLKPWRFMFYVLIGFNTTREYDLYRVEKLRELGTYPFVMPYDKSERYQKDFARWANNKFIWKSVKWENYDCPTNRRNK